MDQSLMFKGAIGQIKEATVTADMSCFLTLVSCFLASAVSVKSKQESQSLIACMQAVDTRLKHIRRHQTLTEGELSVIMSADVQPRSQNTMGCLKED